MARRCLMSDTASPPAAAGPGADAALAPALRRDLHGLAMKAAIAGNVAVAALFFAVIVWRLFFRGRDDRGGGASEGAAPNEADGASSSAGSSPCASPRENGVQKEDLMALPVYVHGASAAESVGMAECSVCIGELRDGDTGRLLPRCGHRFHAECVDRWFRSHSTCPLCRAAVADSSSGGAKPKVVA